MHAHAAQTNKTLRVSLHHKQLTQRAAQRGADPERKQSFFSAPPTKREIQRKTRRRALAARRPLHKHEPLSGLPRAADRSPAPKRSPRARDAAARKGAVTYPRQAGLQGPGQDARPRRQPARENGVGRIGYWHPRPSTAGKRLAGGDTTASMRTKWGKGRVQVLVDAGVRKVAARPHPGAVTEKKASPPFGVLPCGPRETKQAKHEEKQRRRD